MLEIAGSVAQPRITDLLPTSRRCETVRARKVGGSACKATAHAALNPEGRLRGLWYLLLLIPYAAMFWVASYNRAEPSWAGIPFFYWYQLLWIWIGSALIVIVHLIVNRDRT